MMRLLLVLGALAVAHAGKSPHGEQFLAGLSKEQHAQISNNIIEDSLLDTPGLIKKYGYPVETHEVETEDGYLLTVHRITGARNGTPATRTPILLMHGVLMSSVDWIINGPGRGLGYILADLGFDVWMGNARGNTYSRKHKSLDPDKSAKFWKFSFTEIGYYDIAAKVDYILKETGVSSIHYVGHSQGTTVFYALCSERKEYNAKFKSMHSLAPVAYMGNLKSPLVRFYAPMAGAMEIFGSMVGMNEFLPNNEFYALAAHMLCGEGSIFIPVCTNSLFLLGGYNPGQLNNTMLPVYMSHTPAGGSTRQVVHFCQEHLSYRFRKYDHTYWLNIQEYGVGFPPKFDLGKVTAPVALHYSDNDWLAEPVDVEQLHKELANPIGKFRVTMKEFSHLDYMWGIDAYTLVYERVIAIINLYDK